MELMVLAFDVKHSIDLLSIRKKLVRLSTETELQ